MCELNINLQTLLSSKQRLSEVEKQINELLHILEDCSCDDITLVKVATQLQILRRERRGLKLYTEIPNCNALISYLSNVNSRLEKYKKESEESLLKLNEIT